MDKFVTRPQTWQKLTYSTAVHKAKKELEKRKKPLSEKQQRQPVTPITSRDAGCTPKNRNRLSICDGKLMQILLEKPDEPLVPLNDDSGLSSSSGNTFDTENENILPAKKCQSGELSDFVSCAQNEQTQQTLLIARTPSFDCENNNCANAPTQLFTMERPSTPKGFSTATMQRIQNDLNSPSATLRVRALQALRDPTTSVYAIYDANHAEPSISADIEEALPQPSPPSFQELMQGIVVYVEVRTGIDNRSEGVKKVISSLGARVNDKLLRNTTHVIFKDGLLSTYRKAKKWNIPVVSILWMEACKKHQTICDPKDYRISNEDKYENPELYEKIKPLRCMQPNSEDNKRIRFKRGGTPKTPKPKSRTETRKPSDETVDASKSNSKKQSNISQFFGKLGSLTSSPRLEKDVASTPTTTLQIICGAKTASISNNNDSPATQLLKRIDSNTLTPNLPNLEPATDETLKNTDNTKSKCSLIEVTTIHPPKTRRLDFSKINDGDNPVKEIKVTPVSRVRQRRSSFQVTAARTFNDCPLQGTNTATPRRSMRRRTSLAAATNIISTPMKISDESTTQPEIMCNPSKSNETGEETVLKPKAKKKSPHASRGYKRRSSYTTRPLEITPIKEAKDSKSYKRRRTLYTPKAMEETVSSDLSTQMPIQNKALDDTLLQFAVTPTTVTGSKTETELHGNPKSLIEEFSSSPNLFSSTRAPNRRRTLFDVSMDIIHQRLININNTARLSMANTQEPKTPEKQTSTIAESGVDMNSNNATKSSIFPANKDEDLPDATPKSIGNEPVNVELPSTQTPKSPLRSIKKRKLYVPNETMMQITASPNKLAAPNVKRRRTIGKLPSTEIKPETRNRRSISWKNEVLSTHSLSITTCASSKSLKVLSQSEPSVPTQQKPTLTFEAQSDPGVPIRNPESHFHIPVESVFSNEKIEELKAESSKIICITSNAENIPKENQENVVNKANISDEVVANTETDEANSLPVHLPTPSVPSSKANITPTPTPKSQQAQNIHKGRSVKPVSSETINSLPPVLPKAIPTTKTVQPVKVTETDCAPKFTPGINVVQKKKWPYIVCTNMHREQVKVIREAIATLGAFDLDHCVSNDTTHVVSYEPRRTLNLLRALIRGLWILEYRWVTDSLQAGEWLPEEDYELKDFTRAVVICRAERQAFGAMYKCELFADLCPFYVSSRCGPISKDNLKELIELCGGKIVDYRKRAKYIIGDPSKPMEDKVHVTPFWILDSITQMQMMRIQKYTYSQTPRVHTPQILATDTQSTQTLPMPTGAEVKAVETNG